MVLYLQITEKSKSHIVFDIEVRQLLWLLVSLRRLDSLEELLLITDLLWYKLVFIFSFEMLLTDSSRKVQQFKELDWRGLLKTCDILIERSGKSGGLPFEQSGKSRGLELEQSGKSRGLKFEQCGNTRNILLEQSGKSRGLLLEQ